MRVLIPIGQGFYCCGDENSVLLGSPAPPPGEHGRAQRFVAYSNGFQ